MQMIVALAGHNFLGEMARHNLARRGPQRSQKWLVRLAAVVKRSERLAVNIHRNRIWREAHLRGETCCQNKTKNRKRSPAFHFSKCIAPPQSVSGKEGTTR